MAKVTITADGIAETFEFDGTRKPMSEALAIENTLGIPHARWEADLAAGSARALCGFIWLVWRRAGREVPFADIESGKIGLDVNDAFSVEPDDGPEPGPTSPGSSPAAAPEASSSTSGATSRRSAR